MAESAEIAIAGTPEPAKGKAKKGKTGLILLVLALLLVIGGGGAAVAFVPAVQAMVKSLTGGAKPAQAEIDKPFFVEVPEITVTMPNGGRARQLRIKLALELAKHPKDGNAADILTPRIYDALVLYLRTLHDPDVEGALSIDRMRGDLQRRLDLLVGDGVLRDVLITSLIIG